MMRIILIMMAIMIESWGFENHRIEPASIQDGNYMKIKILDSKVLTLKKIDGVKFREISDIAYDANRDIFYALSDKGALFKLSIMIEDGKLKALTPISGAKLTNVNNKKLLRPYKDSEGLALMQMGDKKALLVSFERKPRVTLYHDNAQAQRDIPLPIALKNINRYSGKNKALESLAYDEYHGFITAAEFPLRATKRGYHDIYNSRGKLCRIKQRDAKTAITEMEMMPDGNLLVLMRKFELSSFSFETTLVKVRLDDQRDGVCKREILAWMSSKEGWAIDNFEGLTHIRDNLYMMVSDNNSNRFEKTIITLFEIKE